MKSTKNNSVENILNHLINGIDPKTGEQLSENNPLKNEHIQSSLILLLGEVKAYRIEQVRRLNFPANTGKPWSEFEEKKLINAYDLGHSIEQLAKTFKRTKGAIRARLILLGKIEEVHTNDGKYY